MRSITKTILKLLALIGCQSLQAQQLSGAYFMNGYACGHELNPAKDFDRDGYFSLPIIPSNVTFSKRGNMGLKDLFRANPEGDGIITYLHPSLSTEDVLGRFHENNKIVSDIRYDLLTFGFRSKHAYQNFTFGLRTTFDMDIPYEFFELTKDIQKRDYSIRDFNFNTKAWFELGWGYSREIANCVRIGAKAKLLLGLGSVNIDLNSMDLDLNDSQNWSVKSDATVEMGVRGFTWGETNTKKYSESYMAAHPDSPTEYQAIDLDNFDFEGPCFNNVGIGVDLGTEVNLDKAGIVPGLKFSAAVLDLGFIRWRDMATAKNMGNEFIFKGFKEYKKNDDNSIDFEDLGDAVSNLFALQDAGHTSKNVKIGATLNLGVEYALPFHDKKISLGFLSTTRFKGVYSWNKEHVALNYRPAKWLEMGVNIGVGTEGSSFGWIANIHPNGFNLFVGCDHLISKHHAETLPLKNNTDIAVGINFPIGKS